MTTPNQEVHSFSGMLDLPNATCGNPTCSCYGKDDVSILYLNKVAAHGYSLMYYKCRVCGHVDFIKKDNGRERHLLAHILMLSEKDDLKKEAKREYYKNKKGKK